MGLQYHVVNVPKYRMKRLYDKHWLAVCWPKINRTMPAEASWTGRRAFNYEPHPYVTERVTKV